MNKKEIESTLEEVITTRLEILAAEQGDAKYLYYGEDKKTFTYQEFNDKTNSIANFLNKTGVKKGEVVPVFLRNSLISTFSMFGIWKVGAVYSPINYSYQGRLLSYQLNDIQAKILITERQFIPLINNIISETTVELVIIYNPATGEHDYIEGAENEKLKDVKEVDFAELEKQSSASVKNEIYSSDIANIIYTSGTTGPPKGVVQTHRWINQYTFYRRNFFNEEDVIYNDLPLYHVGGAFFNIVSATWAGASIALWDKFSGTNFWRRIKESGATSVLLLDVMIPWLLNVPKSIDDHKNSVSKVYMQPLPQNHNIVAKRFGFDIVMSGFGQTEAGQGIVGVIKELADDKGTPINLLKGKSPQEIIETSERLNVPITPGDRVLGKGFMGKPSMLLEAAILNEKDEECLPEEVGQLAFRPKYPDLLFSEYYNKNKETIKSFENLWFHTGDICYKNQNGEYFFIDRMSGIIRVKGEFISSFQVEDYLNEHEMVEMAAVLPVPADIGDEDDIAAFIVLKERNVLESKDIELWIRKKMPKYMWPKYIKFVTELPRTPSNKIEKYKLKETLKEELEII